MRTNSQTNPETQLSLMLGASGLTRSRPTKARHLRSGRIRLGGSLIAWVGGGMLIGLLVLLIIAGRYRESAFGKPLPSLDLSPLLGTETKVDQKDLKGKVVFLHIWGTWCPDCRREFPELIKIYEHYKDSDEVVFLSVSCTAEAERDLEELKKTTQEYYDSLGVNMPTYCDSAAYTRMQLSLVVPSGSTRYPTTVIVDREGLIRDVWEERLPLAAEVIRRVELVRKE